MSKNNKYPPFIRNCLWLEKEWQKRSDKGLRLISDPTLSSEIIVAMDDMIAIANETKAVLSEILSLKEQAEYE